MKIPDDFVKFRKDAAASAANSMYKSSGGLFDRYCEEFGIPRQSKRFPLKFRVSDSGSSKYQAIWRSKDAVCYETARLPYKQGGRPAV